MKNQKKFIINELSKYYSKGIDSDFALKLGITPQTLSNWKSRNTIDYDLIYTKCVEINPEWLLTAKGAMLKEKYIQQRGENTQAAEEKAEYSAKEELPHGLKEAHLRIIGLIQELLMKEREIASLKGELAKKVSE